MPPAKTIQSIQALRGIAATSVVISHFDLVGGAEAGYAFWSGSFAEAVGNSGHTSLHDCVFGDFLQTHRTTCQYLPAEIVLGRKESVPAKAI
jgi:hypothetical protein